MRQVLCIVLLSVACWATKHTAWSTGKLLDLQRYDTGAGAARAQGEYCFSVAVGDFAYLTRYQPYWRHSYDPTEMTVGGSVEAMVSGNALFIRTPKGRSLKTHISRREQVQANKHPASCAARVQSSD